MSERAEHAILELVATRGQGKTICPSEAARAPAGPEGDWHAYMDRVHASADAVYAAGKISLSWKGEELDQRRGAYRIARR